MIFIYINYVKSTVVWQYSCSISSDENKTAWVQAGWLIWDWGGTVPPCFVFIWFMNSDFLRFMLPHPHAFRKSSRSVIFSSLISCLTKTSTFFHAIGFSRIFCRSGGVVGSRNTPISRFLYFNICLSFLLMNSDSLSLCL